MKISILILIYLLSVFHGGRTHVNPCPQFWRYVREAGNYQGRVTIKNPSYSDKFKVRLVLSLSGSLPTDYEGSFDLMTDEYTARQDLQAGRDLNYKVLFPIQQPLPVLLDLQVNGRSICKGEAAHGRISTTIKHFNILESSGQSQSQSLPQNNQDFYYPTNENQYRPQPTYRPQTTYRPYYYQQQQTTQTQLTPLIDLDQPIQFEHHQSNDNSLDAVCGKPEDKAVGLVVRGESYRKGDWPWLSALFYKNEFICGGTLVSQNHVITAAHCVNDKRDYKKRIADLYFIIGAHNLNEQDSVRRSVSTFIQHPDWDPLDQRFDADLAIAVLSSPVQFTRYIKPACMAPPHLNVEATANKFGTLAGWGKTENQYLSTNDPKKVQIPVVSIADCLRAHQDFAEIVSPRTFCAGSQDGRGPCSGDSGGGFMLNQDGKWYLAGIISASLRGTALECNVDQYAIFTNIAKFTTWIRNFIE